MSSIPLTTQDPGTFTYVEGQTFYNEKLAHEILKHAAAMSEEGYEITFEVLDETSWGIQTSTLTNQAAIVSALASDAKMPDAWATRLSTIGSILTSLLTLTMDTANFSLRGMMTALIETVIGTATTRLANPDAEEGDLIDVMKAAFLQESVPGNGVYLTTTIEELKTIKTTLDKMLEAINILAMSENVVQCPHTGHYIYTKSLGKKTL